MFLIRQHYEINIHRDFVKCHASSEDNRCDVALIEPLCSDKPYIACGLQRVNNLAPCSWYSWSCFCHVSMTWLDRTEAHFANNFSIIIQIWWNFSFNVIPLQAIISLQNFAHGTTAVLACHVQNLVVISSLQLKREQNEIHLELELWWKSLIVWTPGPVSCSYHNQAEHTWTWINNYNPQKTVGCNYLSMPKIPASGTKVANSDPLYLLGNIHCKVVLDL